MIEVILINWKRPENVARIAAAFRRQSQPCLLKLCDVSTEEFRLNPETLQCFDEVFTWKRNYGCYNRFVVALSVQSEYVWFHDDDMEPGTELLKSLAAAAHRGGIFGQKGNRLDNMYYSNVPKTTESQQVDFVSRGYLLRSEDIFWIHKFMNKFSLWEYSNHDDILMAKAVQFYTGYSAVLSPQIEPSAMMDMINLPEPYSCWRRPEHRVERTELLSKLRGIFQAHKKIFGVNTELQAQVETHILATP
jgi:hypothetical protein